MREIKLIWDDRDWSNKGWFAREYKQTVVDYETGETRKQVILNGNLTHGATRKQVIYWRRQ